MKKQIQSFLSLMSFAAIGTSAMAWADAPVAPAQPSLAEATQLIASEANVTHDAIEEMLRRLSTQNANIEFNAQDYRAKSAAFQVQVKRLMQEFEAKLNGSILRKLGYWAQRYNAIYNSTTLSSGQKRSLLAQQRSVLDGQVELIQEEYRQALIHVYEAADVPLRVEHTQREARFRERHRLDCGFTHLYSWSPRRGGIVDMYEYRSPLSGRSFRTYACSQTSSFEREEKRILWINMRDSVLSESVEMSQQFGLGRVFEEVVYPALLEGCRSQVCLALSAADLSIFLTLAQSSLDREIKITLADNTELKLNSIGYVDMSLVSRLLGVTDYPASAQSLPFDTE